MAPIDDPVTPEMVLWVAKRVITQHAEARNPYRATGRCRQCRADGCGMLTWAIGVVKAHRVTGNRPNRMGEMPELPPMMA